MDCFADIPARVEHYDSIKVDTSKIPGAGRGVILLRDVKGGEILFKISNPLFMSVCSNLSSLLALIAMMLTITAG